VSSKKPKVTEDLFSSIPPQESFDAFPSLSAFPEGDIAFLTGARPQSADRDAPAPVQPTAPQAEAAVESVSPVASAKPAVRPDTRPLKKPNNQPQDQSDKKPVSQPDRQSATSSASPKTSLSTSHTASRTTSQTEDPSKSQSYNHTEGLSQDQSKNLSADRIRPGNAPDPVAPSDNEGAALAELGRFSPTDRLNANQRRVLDLLLTTKPYIVKFRDIAAACQLREASVRTIMRRLMALSMLTFHKARDGNIQGIRVECNHHLLGEYQQDLSLGQAQGHTVNLSRNLSESLTHSQPDKQPDTEPIPTGASLKKEKKDSSSVSLEETPYGWDQAFLAMMWPRLAREGFGLEQIRQAVQVRERLGRPLDRDMLVVSLDRAEWEIEIKGGLTDLGTGESVRNVAAYVFTALSRWGVLRAHPDYVSREEQALTDALAELRRRQQAADDLDKARYEAFVHGLTPEQRETIMRDFPGGSREAWLKKYWREQVRDAG
jgi:hypothetical protein